MKPAPALLVGAAPFIHEAASAASSTWLTFFLLVPSLLFSALAFGAGIFLVAGTALVSALAADALQALWRRRFELSDGSAALTGLLVAFFMPPGVALYIPAAASLFAVLVVKGAFGGLGNNWMNPALGGLLFAWLNWPAALTGGDAQALGGFGTLVSGMDSTVTRALNLFPFSLLGSELPAGYFGLLMGAKSSSIAELSGFLILAASVVLVARKVIRWQIPASIIAAYLGFRWIFGGLAQGGGYFGGDALSSLFSGSILLVAFFMATDPVTSPSRRPAMTLYGIGAGALAGFLSGNGSGLGPLATAILVMNSLVPLLEGRKGRRTASRRTA